MPALDEDALRKFIAELPDLNKEHEAFGVGEEERLYILGILDAYNILKGEQPNVGSMAEYLREHARKFRVPHEPEWVPLSQGAPYCKTCETRQDAGDVPWHTSPA